jgi:hypothetical protein
MKVNGIFRDLRQPGVVRPLDFISRGIPVNLYFRCGLFAVSISLTTQ